MQDETNHGHLEANLESHGEPEPEVTWGPRLFYAAIIASLVFFWWLLVYDHGAGPVHGG